MIFQCWCFIKTGLCKMGILVIITTTIPFQITIHHISNFISNFFRFFCFFVSCYLFFFNVFCLLIVTCYLSYTLSMFLFSFVYFLSCCLSCFNVFSLSVFWCFLTPFQCFFLLFIYILLWTFLMNWTFIDILCNK